MAKTTVTNTQTNVTIGADILSKNDRHMKVAVDGTTSTINLHKKTPDDKVYVGQLAGMEFVSTGE